MISASILERINAWARGLNLPAGLVAGIVQVESAGNPWAYNPEPHYRYLWNIDRATPFRSLTAAEIASERPPADFPAPPHADCDAEWWGQQASFGLMQVMGAVARERGFRGPYLTELCAVDVGLEFGCRHLEALYRRYGFWSSAVAAYNAGGATRDERGLFRNQAYVDKVVAAAAEHGWRQ